MAKGRAQEVLNKVLLHVFQWVLIGLVSVAGVGLTISGWISIFTGRPWNWIWTVPLSLAVVAGLAYGVAFYLDWRAERAKREAAV